MIGGLRRFLTLQSPARTPDGAGGFTVVWQDVAEVPAEISSAGAREQFAQNRLSGKVTHRIRIRHRDDVTTAMRFLEGSRAYAIRAFSDADPRREFMEILAEEEI